MEPSQLTAGDSWRWPRTDLAGRYPASQGWSLGYVLVNSTGKITFSAGADGDGFQVYLPAAETAAYASGVYSWAAYVTKGADRHQVGRGTIKVLADLAALASHDGLSHARRVLAAIEAVIERRATKDQQAYTIDGRSLTRTPFADLLLLRDRYKREVANEAKAENLRRGAGRGRMVLVRFGGRS